jgi:hypothetical protein
MVTTFQQGNQMAQAGTELQQVKVTSIRTPGSRENRNKAMGVVISSMQSLLPSYISNPWLRGIYYAI